MPTRFRAGSNGNTTPRRPRRKLWRSLVVATAALLLLMADDGIGRDEFLCEVAVTHLVDCCPDFNAKSLYCVRSGCDGSVTPDLDEDRASCLRDKSCDELRALGACDVTRWEPVVSCVAPCSARVPACS